MAGSLAPFALAAEQFSLVSLLSAALASLEIAREFHATEVQFKILLKFQILRVTAVAAGGSHSKSAIKARSHRFVGNAASGNQGWDYGDGGCNDTLVTNAFELRNISRALWVMD